MEFVERLFLCAKPGQRGKLGWIYARKSMLVHMLKHVKLDVMLRGIHLNYASIAVMLSGFLLYFSAHNLCVKYTKKEGGC